MLLGQQIVLDLYNCDYQKLDDEHGLESFIKSVMEQYSIEPLSSYMQVHPNSNDISTIIFYPHGHIVVHSYPEIGFASVDLFSTVTNIALDKIATKIKQSLGAQKAKSTYLKRGDFGSLNDMKPTVHKKIKAWRRVRNTSVKMLKILANKKGSTVD